jgi:hypothetical protein
MDAVAKNFLSLAGIELCIRRPSSIQLQWLSYTGWHFHFKKICCPLNQVGSPARLVAITKPSIEKGEWFSLPRAVSNCWTPGSGLDWVGESLHGDSSSLFDLFNVIFLKFGLCLLPFSLEHIVIFVWYLTRGTMLQPVGRGFETRWGEWIQLPNPWSRKIMFPESRAWPVRGADNLAANCEPTV